MQLTQTQILTIQTTKVLLNRVRAALTAVNMIASGSKFPVQAGRNKDVFVKFWKLKGGMRRKKSKGDKKKINQTKYDEALSIITEL